MIIDFHSHVGETVGKSLEDLLRSMDEAEMDKSVLFAGGSMKLQNNVLIQYLDQRPDRLYGALYADPLYLETTYIRATFKIHMDKLREQLSHPGIVGMKFYCGYEYFYPSDNSVKPYLNLLQEMGKVAIFHCGDTYTVLKNAKLKYAQPIHIDEIAVDYPNLKIVIAHVGFPWHRDVAEIMYKNDNVYTDISGFVYGSFNDSQTDKFDQMLKEFSCIYDSWDRVLFGSDWPISCQKSYKDVVKKFGLLPTLTENTNSLIKLVTS
jgi:predicted TIM-barrel fold metal-dependent hydrolase